MARDYQLEFLLGQLEEALEDRMNIRNADLKKISERMAGELNPGRHMRR